MTGTMARPSRPSVRFTALPAPTITKAPKRMKKMPRSITTSLKKGTARTVSRLRIAGSDDYHDTATPAMTASTRETGAAGKALVRLASSTFR